MFALNRKMVHRLILIMKKLIVVLWLGQIV